MQPSRLPVARHLAVAGALLLAVAVSAQTPNASPQLSATEQRALEHFQAQDWAAAAKAYEAASAAGAITPGGLLNLGIALHNTERYDAALAALAKAEAAGAAPIQLAMRRSRSHLRLGNLDAAFAALDVAAKAGFAGISLLDTDPELAPLRADARFAVAREAVDRNLHPCLYDPVYRGFDFWVGEWDVVPTGTTPGPTVPVSRSSIQLILDGCIVFENWTGAGGYAGKSFNLWDATRRRWQQTWVDNAGGIIEFYGQLDADGTLRYEGERPNPSGTGTIQSKLVFHNLGPDRKRPQQIRQVWEQSTDGGATWTVAFDGTYTRRP